MMGLDSFVMEQFDKGGPLMWPLLAASVVALTFILERFWTLHRIPGDEKAKAQVADLLSGVGRLEEEELLASLSKRRGVLASVYTSVLRKHMALRAEGLPVVEHREELIREADLSSREYLGQFLPVLSTVGAVSPLLGLLGTITGMIKAFAAIAVAGVGDPGKVADGVSEALITTATGLIVAIPVIVLHRYLAVRAGRAMRRVELYTRALGHRLLEGE